MPQKRLYFAADEKLISALGDSLRRSGLAVETFEQQGELVARVREDPPDVVLLGSRLVDGNALGVFRALAPKPPPTIVILNAGQHAFRVGLLRAGVSDVVVAPVRPRQLSQRLMDLAGGHRRTESRERTALPIEIDLEGRTLRGTTVDVSREGLGAWLDGEVPEDLAVAVTVKPPSGSALKVFARLVHSDPIDGRIRAGFRLLGLTQEEESVLLQIAKANPSAEVPLVIERRLPKSRLVPDPVEEQPAPVPPPLSPPPLRKPEAEPSLVRWPESAPTLVQALEHLRFAIDLQRATVSTGEAVERAPLETAAIRFAAGLSSLEKDAFASEPEIAIVMDDQPVPAPADASNGMDPSLATLLCLGAGHRFRALWAEKAGRALFDGPASRRLTEQMVEIDSKPIEALLSALRAWAVEAQAVVYDAQVTRERELARSVQSLQDLAAKQAFSLQEVVQYARDVLARIAEETSAKSEVSASA